MHIARQFAIALLFLPCLFVDIPAAHADIFLRHQGDETAVVFLHGIRSNADDSFIVQGTSRPIYDHWTESEDVSEAGQALRNFSYYSVEYPSRTCSNFTIPEIANRVVSDLRQADIFEDYNQIVIISHSLGGLISKEVMRQLLEVERSSVASMIFLGVPSEGANIADVAYNLAPLNCNLVRDLTSISGNSFLISLDRFWNQYIAGNEIGYRPQLSCAYERRAVRFNVVVVPLERVDRDCDELLGFDLNHEEIDGPSVGSTEYNWMIGAVLGGLDAHAVGAGSPTRFVDDLRFELRATTDAIVAGYPRNFQRLAITRVLGEEISIASDFPRFAECGEGTGIGLTPSASARGVAFRESRLGFRVAADLSVSFPEGVSLCDASSGENLIVSEVSADVSFSVNGRVQIGFEPTSLLIDIFGLPEPTVELFLEGSELAIDPIVSLDRSGEGELALYYGVIEFVDLEPGNYFLIYNSSGQMILNGSDVDFRTGETSFSGNLRFELGTAE